MGHEGGFLALVVFGENKFILKSSQGLVWLEDLLQDAFVIGYYKKRLFMSHLDSFCHIS